MSFFNSPRKVRLATILVGGLTLSACAAQTGASRYGECAYPCQAQYQQSYVETYYQVPVAPVPAPLPEPTPPVVITPPAISCPSDTIIHSNGTCMQIEQPPYIPQPPIGYTPDPVAPPKVYKPIRK